jgi:hypothetical protein
MPAIIVGAVKHSKLSAPMVAAPPLRVARPADRVTLLLWSRDYEDKGLEFNVIAFRKIRLKLY